LPVDEHPFVKPGWQLAHRVLKNAGFTLDWIELDRSIRAELVQCRELLEDQLTWASEALVSTESKGQVEAQLSHRCRWTIATFTRRAEQLNERIELFNLKVPLTTLQKQKIQVAEETHRFRASWRKTTELHSHGSTPSSFFTNDTARAK
jgi:hypothetical protein